MEKAKLKCEVCGSFFESLRVDAKYCGRSCANKVQWKKYYAKNREGLIKKSSQWHKNNPGRSRELKRAEYQRHKEKYQAWGKKYYADNLEKIEVRRKKYYWSDPEKFRADARAYRAKNPEEKKRIDDEYKDKIRHGGFRENLLHEADYKCADCGKDTRDSWRDSVVHHETGNPKDHSQQVPLCRSCHARRHKLKRVSGS